MYFYHRVGQVYLKSVRLFACLFGNFCPTRDFFTHLETSPLTVKGYKFSSMLSGHSHI